MNLLTNAKASYCARRQSSFLGESLIETYNGVFSFIMIAAPKTINDVNEIKNKILSTSQDKKISP